VFYGILLTRTSNEAERSVGTFTEWPLGDQLKPVDPVKSEPAEIIHGRDIASDSLAYRLVALVLLIEELANRTRDMIFLRLETIRLCRIDDFVSLGKAELVGIAIEEEADFGFGFHGVGFCILIIKDFVKGVNRQFRYFLRLGMPRSSRRFFYGLSV
jgi:hypothetical protein